MKEAMLVSTIQRSLLIKFSLLALLTFGVVLATPVTRFAGEVAHQICPRPHNHGANCRPPEPWRQQRRFGEEEPPAITEGR